MCETKECFKCHRILPLTEFYKHSQMGDGHLNKCKDCTKRDVKMNYIKNAESPEYIEKERERGREKYRRLEYSQKKSVACLAKRRKYPSLKNARRDINGNYPPGTELHHWNYNDNKHLIVLDRRLHHRLHTAVSFNLTEGIYYFENRALDTIDKHLAVIQDVCGMYGFDFSKVQVL